MQHNFLKFFWVGGLVLLLGAGCASGLNVTAQPDEEYTVYYYPTQCNSNPWGKQLDPILIQDYYTSVGVNVEDVLVEKPAVGLMTCSACGCPTGYTIQLETDSAGRAKLLELGFTEEAAEPIEDDANVNKVLPPVGNENTNVSTSEVVLPNTTDTNISDDDALLAVTAGRIQTALSDYFKLHGSYPSTLADLNLDIDPTGVSYTPIGVEPADFYDLTVDYSTGQETLNP